MTASEAIANFSDGVDGARSGIGLAWELCQDGCRWATLWRSAVHTITEIRTMTKCRLSKLNAVYRCTLELALIVVRKNRLSWWTTCYGWRG